MKTVITLLFFILFALFLQAQNIQLPFSDDFSNEYENWQHYSISGNDQWHLSGDDGINGSKCARFYITTNPPQANDDWLVLNTINTQDISNIAIAFKFLYHGDGISPKFYYTNSFNGDINSTQWTEIDNSFWINPWAWNNARLEIESLGNTLVFAIRYQSTIANSNYILIDNFSIESFEPVIEIKTGETDHFEYYTTFANETNYWLEIKDTLEINYKKYCDIWNIQGKEDFIDKNIKTKVLYTNKSNIQLISEQTPETKSGFFDRPTKTIYLSPLNTPEKRNYYENLEGLAINTFAGYAKKHQLYRDRNKNDYLPDYYTEGFGLYEQGFRPRLDSITKFRSTHTKDLTHEDLNVMDVFNSTSQKDIIVSYVEGQIICSLDYFGEAPYGSYPPIWNNYLTYFYDTTDVVRIQKYATSENFDVYCSSRDTAHIDSFLVWLNRTRQFYTDAYQMEINRKYNLVIYYDEKTGMDMTGYDNWNGGAGGLNISPDNYPDYRGGGYKWLLAHEFGHVFNSLIYPEMPFGFYHEGMANFSGFMQYNTDWVESRVRIESVLYYFLKNFNREPTLNEFISNPYEQDGGNIDPYYFGLEFIRYLYEEEGLLKIKEFFRNELDFSVFSKSYNEIENEYIKRLKWYQNLTPTDTVFKVPFYEPFDDFSNGWTKHSLLNPDNWNINDGGINGTNCARYYTYSNDVPIDSWLVSPSLDTKGLQSLQISFDFARFGDGIEIEILYTDNFKGYTDSTIWTSVKSIEMPIDWGWSNTGEINIENPPKNVFIAIRQKSPGFQHLQMYIDNFNVTGIKTDLKIISEIEQNLKIFPNPVTTESVISFQIKTSENINLSIFDIQGRKICTLLEKKLLIGNHSFPLGNTFLQKGIYLIKLQTSEGISTKKIIWEK